jgi:hypothetical protein
MLLPSDTFKRSKLRNVSFIKKYIFELELFFLMNSLFFYTKYILKCFYKRFLR